MYAQAIELKMQQATETSDATRMALLQKLAEDYHANGFEGYLRGLVALASEENPDRNSYRIAHCYAMLGRKIWHSNIWSGRIRRTLPIFSL